MLELPSALASPSAPSPAAVAAARASDKEGAGFQGRLREALGSQDAQQQAGMNQAEAKRAQLPKTSKGVEEGRPASEMLAVEGAVAAEGQFSEFTLADALPAALVQAKDGVVGPITPLALPQGSVTAQSEALVNAAMSSNQSFLAPAIVGTSFGGSAKAPDAMPPQALSDEAGLVGDSPTHPAITGLASMLAGAMPASAQMPSAAALKDAEAPIPDQLKAQTAAMQPSATLAGAAPSQVAGQKLDAAPAQLMGQVLPSQPDMMVPNDQILAAANQQRGPGAMGQPAGQATPAQSAMVQQGDQNFAAPEQQAIIATLAAGPSQMAAAQSGKPLQPIQAAPKAGTPAPVEAAEAAKSAIPSALLAQSLGAGDAVQEASAILQQQAIITTPAAGPSQVAAAQSGKPLQPIQTAPKVGIPTSVEAAEAAKSAIPSALLAQSLGAGDAAQEATAILPSEAAEASLHAVEPTAPKTVIAKHVVENESHIVPGQGFGFAISDGALSRADAPMQTAAARELPAPPPPVRQLAPVLVSLALGGGNEALTITLDPGELGRVEVSIGQGKDAGQVRIIAERPETLALLQRDQRELDRSLTQAGLGDMARSLSFSLASDQGRQQHHHTAQEGANRFAALAGGQEAERPLTPIPAPLRASTSLIDLAV